jgi:cytochrome P450
MSSIDEQAQPDVRNFELFKTMRDSTPVRRDQDSGAWHVYRYDDVVRVLSNADRFSSDFGQVIPDRGELTEGNIIAMDPPRHDQLRSLVSLAFTPRSIAQLEGRIAELTDCLLDDLNGATKIELVQDLAYPLPVIVIAELLGVPTADRPRFKVWADALLNRSDNDLTSEEAVAAAAPQIRNFHDYLREHVIQRRERPRADLLSDLVAAEIDGQRLSDDEIVGFATILLLAGHITTSLLLGNALVCLDEKPQAQSLLRANPGAIPHAIEEVLRYRSPVPMTARVSRVDVQVGGQLIPARQMVYVWLASANHDERRFEDAEEFVPNRYPNPHVAFGKGIHFCLGAPLARLEARVALAALLRRFASIRVDPGQPTEWYPRLGGPRALHLIVSE